MARQGSIITMPATTTVMTTAMMTGMGTRMIMLLQEICWDCFYRQSFHFFVPIALFPLSLTTVRLLHPVQFVPMLSTWLNGDRWEDDLPGPRGDRVTQADRTQAILARYAGPEGEAS